MIKKSAGLALVLSFLASCSESDGKKPGIESENSIEALSLSISAGQRFSCVHLPNKTVKCWGEGAQGQLGDGTNTSRAAPAAAVIDFGAGNVVKAISSGWTHACALLENGTIQCWGDNSTGALGLGHTDPVSAPAVLPVDLGEGHTAKAIFAGNQYSCAILDNDAVKCWGANDYGQLGYFHRNRLTSPSLDTVNLGSGRTVKSLATGQTHACAVLDDNTLKCWGDNNRGQLGYGSRAYIDAPPADAVNLGEGKTALAVAAGARFTCVILGDASVKCWGNNEYGQLGYGALDAIITAPPPTSNSIGEGRTAKIITTKSIHVCVVLDNGTLKCWGSNRNGELGYGEKGHVPPSENTGVNLGESRLARSVSAGDTHTCSVLDDNSVKCWGSNFRGQLGYGDTTDLNQPSATGIDVKGK